MGFHRKPLSRKRFYYVILGLFLGFTAMYSYHNQSSQGNIQNQKLSEATINSDHVGIQRAYQYKDYNNTPGNIVYYKKDTPLVWIGGRPEGNVKLLCAILDSHGGLRCGARTRVVSLILYTHAMLSRSKRESEALKEAKVDTTVLNRAMGAYILSIMSQNGEIAARICNWDSQILMYTSKILEIFPKSKFILLIGGYSTTTRNPLKVTDEKKDELEIRREGKDKMVMYRQCEHAGPSVCLSVFNRNLMSKRKEEIQKILTFLNIPWSDSDFAK